MAHHNKHTHILLIGLDGGTPTLFQHLIQSGALPFLSTQLSCAAVRGLASIPPYATPAAWPTIYTGMTPGHHGVLDFVDLTDSSRRLVTSASIRAETLWRSLSRHHKRLAMIGFPLTYPPEPVNGVMVSGIPSPHREGAWSHPTELTPMLREIPGFTPDPGMTSPTIDIRPAVAYLKQHVHAITQAALLADAHYGAEGWDLFGVHFQALDAFQHMFWAWIDPQDHRFADRPAAERAFVSSFFKSLDEAIRCLVEALRPQEIVLLSDHGFGPAYEAVCLNQLLYETGLLRLSIRPSTLRAWLAAQRVIRGLDVLNLRARMKFSVRGNVGLDQVRRDKLIDREHSPAFAFSGGYCGLLEVNPGAESAVREILLSVRHPKRQTPLIKSVHFISELWEGPWAEAWRHIAIIQPEEGYLIDTHFRPQGIVAPVSAGLTGTHRPTGLLWTTLNTLRDAHSILDIAPGILRALGIPMPTAPAELSSDTRAVSLSIQEQAAIEARLRQLGYL